MNHSRWILALEIIELEENYSAIFVEELELVLAGNSELTWYNPASASIGSKDYMTIIDEFKLENSRNKDSLISTQIPIETEAQRQLTQPVIGGSQVFRNTKLVENNLRVIVVYDSAGLPVHKAELELMNHQIAEYAVNEDLPIRIEPLSTQDFLRTDTSNAALIIWNDMGAGGANFTSELVQKFKLGYNSGIPFLALGADLTSYHLNMDSEDSFETSEDWSKLIHLGLSPDQGNPFISRRILVTPDAEAHASAIGPYGIISEFTYNFALDHPSQVKEGGVVFAVDQFGNSQAVISDLSSDTAPTFALNCLLHLINEQDVSEKLFKNVISNILNPLKVAVN
ncbi:MAG: hypothetical protein AB8G05_08810 [Oligoflexales bacterium]